METRGRKKRTLLDAMRAKAWFAGIKAVSGLPTAYQIAEAFLDSEEEEKRNFDKYQRGAMSPGERTLAMVENKWPGTSKIFDAAPDLPTGYFPIWKALSGTMEELWDIVLAGFDPAFERSRLFGFNQHHRIQRLLSHMLAPGDKILLQPGPLISDLNHEGMGSFEEPENGYTPADFIRKETGIWIFKSPIDTRQSHIDYKGDNPVATRWDEGRLKIDVNSLAATVAIWRLSHFFGEGWYEMDTVIRGLTLAPGVLVQRDAAGVVVGKLPATNQPSAIDSVLGPYGIEGDFLVLLDEIWQKSVHKYLAVVHSIPSKQPGESRAKKKEAAAP